MTQSMTRTIEIAPVRKSIRVAASQSHAFEVFTSGIGRWWPKKNHSIGPAPMKAMIIEQRLGGRWYELGEDGSTCDWGQVLVWEPPSRLVLSWDISADWQHDPALKTEVEIRFIPESSSVTLVELEHRRLDRYGARRDEMRRIFESEAAWGQPLATFARVAATAG